VMEVESFGDLVQAIRVKPGKTSTTSKPAVNNSKDAATMFWAKAYELGMDREVAQALVEKNGGNFVNAFDELTA
jgi:hypothetical protein